MLRRTLTGGSQDHLDRYAAAVVLLIICILSTGFAGNSTSARVAAVAIEGGTLMFILWTSGVKMRTLRFTAVAVAAAVLADLGLSISGVPAGLSWAHFAIAAGLAVGAPVAIVRRLLQQDEIRGSTVMGALSLYLLAGYFFALADGTLNAVGGGDFFVQTDHPQTLDFIYFSFVTLTTVGYGDYTAATGAGRMLAITEALGGQLYLVSVVALLVSNLGRARVRRRADIEQTEAPTPARPTPSDQPDNRST